MEVTYFWPAWLSKSYHRRWAAKLLEKYQGEEVVGGWVGENVSSCAVGSVVLGAGVGSGVGAGVGAVVGAGVGAGVGEEVGV